MCGAFAFLCLPCRAHGLAHASGLQVPGLGQSFPKLTTTTRFCRASLGFLLISQVRLLLASAIAAPGSRDAVAFATALVTPCRWPPPPLRHHTAGAQASHKLRVRQKLTTLEMVFVMQLESPSDLPAFSAADFWQPCREQGTQSRNSPKSKCHRHSQSYLNSVVPLGWTNFWFISWL